MPKIKTPARRESETINVTPRWWHAIHHKPGGAFLMALQLALKKLTVYELHATETELLLVVPKGAATADAVREFIETSLSIEPSDRLPDAAPDKPGGKTMTRKAFEKALIEMDMHPATGAPHVWTVSTVSVYVRLDKNGADNNRCSVETNDGEGPRPYSYAGALAKLEAFAEAAGDVTDEELGEIDSLGSAPGGILKQRW
jgi:hypothetical protein